MISFNQVCISESGKELLTGISFDIKAGDNVVFTGPSGSGKTTIMLTLLGVYQPVSGSISFHDKTITPETIHSVRHQIAYVPQQPIAGGDTAYDALMLPFQFKSNHHTPKPTSEQLVEAITKLNLKPSILPSPIRTLSGGELQRLVIARSLLLGKTIFLLDEITSALDKASKQAVIDMFSQKENTILSISHDNDWIKTCTREIEINGGQISHIKDRHQSGSDRAA